jgi:hypothetical protein
MRGLLRPGFRALPAAKRRVMAVTMAVLVGFTAFVGWLFATGHPVVALALLVAFYILPELVLIPLRIRRSRRAAEAARARRTGSPPR